MGKTGRGRRHRVEPTDDWGQLELLCGWPEQRDYELIRPIVLFGSSASRRASETGAASERTLLRRAAAFDAEGMESLFGSEHARRKKLPPAVRRLIVDLKAEHPPLRPNEIATICYVRFGRRPDLKTVARVLAEEPIPLRIMRRFAPYHEIPELRERRLAVVSLHAEGWSAKAIAGYLRINRDTVYQVGIHLSPRTCGRILAVNRALYGLEKPKGPSKEKREMPFAARRRHQYWSADVRYLKGLKLSGRFYVISVLDNHSRAILASAVVRSRDLTSHLSVLYVAVKEYGSPEALVTDGGGIFRATQARAVYEALGVAKHEIERGRPWQNLVETQFNVQRRMADHPFSEAEDWPELVEAHARFVEDYNHQPHWAHREREDGRRAPLEVLGFVAGVRHREEELRRAFFSTRFLRVLDSFGYARFKNWRLYGEEALAGSEAALWLASESLTVEHRGEALSRYEVEVEASTGRIREVGRPRLFGTALARPQPLRLFALDELGEGGWLKAMRLEGYAPRAPRGPRSLQQALFPYAEAL